MVKTILLISGAKNETYEYFSERIISIVNFIKDDTETIRIKLTYTKLPPPKFSVIPFKKEKIAAISIFSETKMNFDLPSIQPNSIGIYIVDESIPVAYNKSWNDMDETPGICLLTLFQKKKGLNYDSFIDRWHNGHTPLSLKIHPLWNYNRNVVKDIFPKNSKHWDGIVEEHFKTESDLLNPIKFFGNPFIMIYRMLQVYFDTKSFLDYGTIEPYYTTEIHIKS